METQEESIDQCKYGYKLYSQSTGIVHLNALLKKRQIWRGKMSEKIIFIFNIILLITLGIMIILIKSKYGSNEKLPLVFIGIFALLIIIFITIYIKNRFFVK